MHWSSSQETIFTIDCLATDDGWHSQLQSRFSSLEKGHSIAKSLFRIAATVFVRFIREQMNPFKYYNLSNQLAYYGVYWEFQFSSDDNP